MYNVYMYVVLEKSSDIIIIILFVYMLNHWSKFVTPVPQAVANVTVS